MSTAIYRVLEIRHGENFVPIGVLASEGMTNPIGTAFVRMGNEYVDLRLRALLRTAEGLTSPIDDPDFFRRADGYLDLPVQTLLAGLVLYDQTHLSTTYLPDLEVPAQFAEWFRLSDVRSFLLTDDAENLAAHVAAETIQAAPFYAGHERCTLQCTEPRRLIEPPLLAA